jgi:hypothetical protein
MEPKQIGEETKKDTEWNIHGVLNKLLTIIYFKEDNFKL